MDDMIDFKLHKVDEEQLEDTQKIEYLDETVQDGDDQVAKFNQ